MISKKDVLRVAEAAFEALGTEGGAYDPETCEVYRHDAEAVGEIVMEVLRATPAEKLRRKGVTLEGL